MRLIWATRGRQWGFRFLRTGGFEDPLAAYEAAFAGLESAVETCTRVGDWVALRFADPLGRVDRAGRVIPHDFVVFEPEAIWLHTVEDGRRLVWPAVEQEYAERWDG